MKRWSLDARSQAPLDWSDRFWKREDECAQSKNNASAAFGERRKKLDARS